MSITSLVQAARSAGVSSSGTGYWPISGDLKTNATESYAQAYIGASLTARYLLVNISSNANGVTVRTRKNAANGGLSISASAGETGTFEDTSGSDSLASADLYNFQTVPTSGSVVIKQFSVTFDHATAGIAFPSHVPSLSLTFNATYYYGFGGEAANNTSEAGAKFTIRYAANVTRLVFVCSGNTVNATSTVRTRKNGGNGAQSVSIGASATGRFTDTTNTDSLVSGDAFNFQVVTGGTSGTMTPTLCECQLLATSTGYTYFEMVAGKQPGQALNANNTYYLPVQGFLYSNTTEADVQLKTRFAFAGAFFFANITANSVNGASTLRSRKNGANGALSVSVGASATGTFEDQTDSETYLSTDSINVQIATGGSSGTTTITLAGWSGRTTLSVTIDIDWVDALEALAT